MTDLGELAARIEASLRPNPPAPLCPLREFMVVLISAIGNSQLRIDAHCRDWSKCIGAMCAFAVEGRCGLVKP